MTNERFETTERSVREKLAKMMKSKLVIKVSSNFTRSGYVYTLTKAGYDRYSQLSNRVVPSRLDQSKLRFNQQVPHDLGVQTVVAVFYRDRQITSYQTQFEMTFKATESTTLPDAIVQWHDGDNCAIEFEATPKSNKRLSHRNTNEMPIFERQINCINNHHYEHVFYVLMSESAKVRYREQLLKIVKSIYRDVELDAEEREHFPNAFSFYVDDYELRNTINNTVYKDSDVMPDLNNII